MNNQDIYSYDNADLIREILLDEMNSLTEIKDELNIKSSWEYPVLTLTNTNMLLVNDLVKFRDHEEIFRVEEIDDEGPSRENDPRYIVTNTETDRPYSFWVSDEDLEYIPEGF